MTTGVRFEHPYSLLSRLMADCEYYLGSLEKSGADMKAAQRHLWAGSVEDQIALMRELYVRVPEKPEWISAEEIDEYEREMLAARKKAEGKRPRPDKVAEGAKGVSARAAGGDADTVSRDHGKGR